MPKISALPVAVVTRIISFAIAYIKSDDGFSPDLKCTYKVLTLAVKIFALVVQCWTRPTVAVRLTIGAGPAVLSVQV